MTEDDTRDRTDIHDLFNRYADAVAGHQWELLDEVFTEDVTSARRGSPEIEFLTQRRSPLHSRPAAGLKESVTRL